MLFYFDEDSLDSSQWAARNPHRNAGLRREPRLRPNSGRRNGLNKPDFALFDRRGFAAEADDTNDSRCGDNAGRAILYVKASENVSGE
jgi:hypothetical protein